MRKIVTDFNLTVLWPLTLFALIVLFSSIRGFLSSRTDYRAAIERLKGTFETREEGEELLEWGRTRREENWKYKGFIWVSSVVFVVLCAVILTPDKWKADIAYLSWNALMYVGELSFIVAIAMAWHYAKKLDWLRLGICLLAMLIAAASAEHFFHQTINARHVTCLHCSDEDDEPDDN